MWQKKRLEIFKRDDFTCQFCGDKETELNAHHLLYLPNREPWAYDDDCLLTICEKCHKEEHRMKELDPFLINNFSLTGLGRHKLFAFTLQLRRYLRNKPDHHQRFINLLEFMGGDKV